MFRRRQPDARPPIHDLGATLEVAGHALALPDVQVGARVEDRRLEVQVHHPAFADLSEDVRLLAAQEVLVATLGEVGTQRAVARLSAVTFPPIDSFGVESLRSFVRSLGIPVDPPEA